MITSKDIELQTSLWESSRDWEANVPAPIGSMALLWESHVKLMKEHVALEKRHKALFELVAGIVYKEDD